MLVQSFFLQRGFTLNSVPSVILVPIKDLLYLSRLPLLQLLSQQLQKMAEVITTSSLIFNYFFLL